MIRKNSIRKGASNGQTARTSKQITLQLTERDPGRVCPFSSDLPQYRQQWCLTMEIKDRCKHLADVILQ